MLPQELTSENLVTLIGIILGNGVITVIISGILANRGKRMDYRDEFYKTIIQKRIKAYELIGELMQNFKKSVANYKGGSENLAYAFFVSSGDSGSATLESVHKQLGKVLVESTWLSYKVTKEISSINHILLPQYSRYF